jgi:hypothetical protein
MLETIKLRKQSTYAAELEHVRRKISKPKSTDPEPYFILNNLDLLAFYKAYPKQCPEVIKSMYDIHGDDINIPNHSVNVRSSLVSHHPEIFRYNDLLKKIITKDQSITKDSVLLAEYEKAKIALKDDIIGDIKSNFISCIEINKTIEKKLKPHIDTLLFVCLYFYNMSWDSSNLTYNSNIAYYSAEKLMPSALPFDYRAIQQVNFISNVLYDYYKSSNNIGKLTIEAGIRSVQIEDPIISKWVIGSMLRDIPASTGYYGMVLQKLIDAKIHMDENEWLKQLKKLTNLELPNYRGVKRKMVREWCLSVHKIFSYYLNLPNTTFDGKRLNIYVKLLKTFNIDDFDILLRSSEKKPKYNRPDAAQTRLRELLLQQPDDKNAS